jgi:hypothetical protein
MAPTKIMLIRHAEKPGKDRSEAGVGKRGNRSSKDLTVRGWQRAGALARFFAPRDGRFVSPALARPTSIFAAGVGPRSRSRRARQTVEPLAELIGVEITDTFLKGQERDLCTALLSHDGVALVAWEHKEIAAIVDSLAGGVAAPSWPEDRFDVVLVLDRAADGWALTQAPQLLLAGDRSDPLA